MRFFALTFLAAVVSAAPTLNFTCPKDDIARTHCMGPKDCLYPNPLNCGTYIQCQVNADGVTGRPTVRQCPANLEWNNEKKWCDWPENSTCPKGSQGSGSGCHA